MAYIPLPLVTVQHDFSDVIRDVDEGILPVDKFWVSCYKSGETSVHATIEVELDPIQRDLVRFKPRDGDVEFVKTSSGYSVACRPLDIPQTSVVLSTQDYSDSMRSQRITAFDVSPDSTRFATGYLDGSVLIYPSIPLLSSSSTQQINTSKRKLVSKAHASTITSLTFFPSSRVLLSTGADFSLSILSAEFPSSWSDSTSGLGTTIHPVRALRGHTRSVTSTCILGLGRNILSTSMDSTLKLWDVPSGSVISTVQASSPVLCSTIGPKIPTPPDAEDLTVSESESGSPVDERDTPEVKQNVSYAGLQNASFEVFDLRTQSSIHKSTAVSSASINTISYLSSQYLLTTGSADGIIAIYDVRSISSPLTQFRRNDSSISDIQFAPGPHSNIASATNITSTDDIDKNGSNVGLAVATTDGLPFIASLIPEGPGVQAELIGVDCDPVRNIRVRSSASDENHHSEVWTASDDGVVRRYVC